MCVCVCVCVGVGVGGEGGGGEPTVSSRVTGVMEVSAFIRCTYGVATLLVLACSFHGWSMLYRELVLGRGRHICHKLECHCKFN